MAVPAMASNDMPLWEEWGYESLEEFLTLAGMTEEEYLEYEAESRDWENRRKARLNKLLEELGGTPGIINVMYNGDFIKFSGSTPEIVEGSAFVPAKPLFEILGATMTYDEKASEITATYAGNSISLIIGQNIVSVTENGNKQEKSIAVAPYIKDGASYVPARAVADAFGIDVYWDRDFKTVVLINEKLIIAEIDKDFTILNKVFSSPILQTRSGGTYIEVLEMLVSLTMFDSLDGDLNLKMGLKTSSISDGRNSHMTIDVDLAELLDYLIELIASNPFIDDEPEENTELIIGALRDLSVETILNYDEGVLYMKTPLLDALIPEFPENAWIAIREIDELLEDDSFSDILELFDLDTLLGATSIGGLIVSNASYSIYYEQAYIYREIMNSAKLIKALLGDDKAVRNGNDYTFTATLEDLIKASEDPYLTATELDMKIAIKTNGAEVTGISGKLIYREDNYTVTRYDCEFDLSVEKQKIDLEIHQKNSMKIRVIIDSSTTETREPVPSAPPAGSKIVEVEDLPSIFGIFEPDQIVPMRLVQ